MQKCARSNSCYLGHGPAGTGDKELFEVSSAEMPWSPRVWGEAFLVGQLTVLRMMDLRQREEPVVEEWDSGRR